MYNIAFHRNGERVINIECEYKNKYLIINGKNFGDFNNVPRDTLTNEWFLEYFTHRDNPVSTLINVCPKSTALVLEIFKRVIISEVDVPNIRLSDKSCWISGIDCKYQFPESMDQMPDPGKILDAFISEFKATYKQDNIIAGPNIQQHQNICKDDETDDDDDEISSGENTSSEEESSEDED